MEKLNKIAQITLIFWLMKIVATTLGETLGDFIAQTMGLGYTVGILITLAFFMIALAIQLTRKKYVPVWFWTLIIATTTLGTEISDFIDRSLHLGYIWGSLLLFLGLMITLLLWYKKFNDLEVNPIFERNKEIYFWIAVLFSNSLGTAFGDYLSDVIGLSFLNGALVTAGIIMVVVLVHYFTKRPFGATFGDFLTKPLAKGGMDLGTLPASLISIVIMALLILASHRGWWRKTGS